MSPSSSPSLARLDLDIRDQLTTTTLFTDPTSLDSNGAESTPVPVAAIAGGTAAAVASCLCWNKRIRNLQKRHKQQVEKRIYVRLGPCPSFLPMPQKTLQAAIAFRRSVINGGKPDSSSADTISSDARRSRPPSLSSKSPSERKVQFAGEPAITPTLPHAQLNAPGAISAPRPLKRSLKSSEKPALPPTTGTPRPRRLRGILAEGKTYRPLKPSPLAHPPSPSPLRATDPGTPNSPGPRTVLVAPGQSVSLETAVRGKLTALDEKADNRGAAGAADTSTSRFPRIKASLSSLTGEMRRQSKASQNSGSDQSRLSSAGGSARRWSWFSLVNGPGFSLRQIGVGTGKNRLSTDTSIMEEWQEEDPSLPVGYAFSGLDEESRGAENGAGNRNGHIFLDTDPYGPDVEKSLPAKPQRT
ncbi:uncharacterized protein FOMMEDRAFT_26520 [Fomitiporia mediterranea MF3/22]|uniref:uncharacterized protein n=1 Tax=Fomitiporia mediterranea (strain MF3/22) TaxID=694068 RepID=UPI00044087CB|nr:uncharacterized protein FOMMEDRAFT_26520 [Fomitiporia mediterranea MF3/22]EJD05653.1 hypothetical protein FOMMEDRAFT_26520 [Fomitiporia mediterranea MF3/22]